MGFILLPEAESDLDGIWLYVARESSSIETANRLIDGIMDRCWLLARSPRIGRTRDHDFAPAFAAFRWASTSFSTAWTRTIFSSLTFFMAVAISNGCSRNK